LTREVRLAVEMVRTSELHEYDGNAKLHPLSQIEQLEESISEFSFADPIGAWHDEDGRAVVVEGHGRLLAARRLGIEELPVVFLDHLTDEERRAYGLVHNKLTMDTGFDASALSDELDFISDIDMGKFNFSVEVTDVDGLFGDLDLSEESYEEPEKKMLTCPLCGHEDSRERFVRA